MADTPIKRQRVRALRYGLSFQDDGLPADYFSTGHWRADTPGPTLRRYTCVVCSAKSTTWPAFLAHRKRCGATGLVDQELAALAEGPGTEDGGAV